MYEIQIDKKLNWHKTIMLHRYATLHAYKMESSNIWTIVRVSRTRTKLLQNDGYQKICEHLIFCALETFFYKNLILALSATSRRQAMAAINISVVNSPDVDLITWSRHVIRLVPAPEPPNSTSQYYVTLDRYKQWSRDLTYSTHSITVMLQSPTL